LHDIVIVGVVAFGPSENSYPDLLLGDLQFPTTNLPVADITQKTFEKL
jgi:hypothetical protein